MGISALAGCRKQPTTPILQQMPEGHRKLKDAYAKVLEKYGGPL
jgi:hypothetical protein